MTHPTTSPEKAQFKTSAVGGGMTGGRWWGWLECSHDEKGGVKYPDLYCPAGHRINWEHAFVEAGYPRCVHRSDAKSAECGKRLFIVFFPRLAQRQAPVIYAAEVTYDEIQDFTKQGYDVPQILGALSCWKSPRAA
jgi:hypothetical protein